MRYIAILWVTIIIGCGIFNPGEDYNPNYTPPNTLTWPYNGE